TSLLTEGTPDVPICTRRPARLGDVRCARSVRRGRARIGGCVLVPGVRGLWFSLPGEGTPSLPERNPRFIRRITPTVESANSGRVPTLTRPSCTYCERSHTRGEDCCCSHRLTGCLDRCARCTGPPRR